MSLINFLAFGVLVLGGKSWAQVHDPDFLFETVLQKKIQPPDARTSRRNPAQAEEVTRQSRHESGWKLVENHPEKEIRRVLLLPGLFGTEFLFHRMLKDSEAEKNGLHLIVGLAPGMAGQKPSETFDFSIPSYAELVETLAEKEKIDLILGQGFMAAVLEEVAVRKKFPGKIMLLTPALEPDDEPLSIRKLDFLSRNSLFKEVLWMGSEPFMEGLLESYSMLPSEDLKRLVAEARRSSMMDSQKILHQYFNHLRSDSRTFIHQLSALPKDQITLIFAGNDSLTLKPENLALLKNSRKIRLIHLPRSSHWVTLDEWKTLNRILQP